MKRVLVTLLIIMVSSFLISCNNKSNNFSSGATSQMQQENHSFLLPNSLAVEQQGNNLKLDFEWLDNEFICNNYGEMEKLHCIYDKKTNTLTTYMWNEQDKHGEFIFNDNHFLVAGTTYSGKTYKIDYSNNHKDLVCVIDNLKIIGNVTETGMAFEVNKEDTLDMRLEYDFSDIKNIKIKQVDNQTKNQIELKYNAEIDENKNWNKLNVSWGEDLSWKIDVALSDKKLEHPWQAIPWIYMEPDDIWGSDWLSLTHALVLCEMSR